MLYLKTIRRKCDQAIHCKIKGRLNISDKNQENVELLERRTGHVKNICDMSSPQKNLFRNSEETV